MDGDPTRAQLRRRAMAIAVAVTPFGLAFGALCATTGLTTWQAVGFSTLVFTGSAQFAAVGIVAAGGGAVAAVAAGLLLNLRSLAFGIVMAPALRGSLAFRLLASQLMIDESMAIGSSARDPALRRHGYLAGGIAVFACWNLSTLVGALALEGAGTLVTDLGIDGTIPAAFLALLWPRLGSRHGRRLAGVGALIAVATWWTPAGVPILLAGLAVAVVGPGTPDGATDRAGAGAAP